VSDQGYGGDPGSQDPPFVVPNLDPTQIPGQSNSTWSHPNGAAPNFLGDAKVDTASLLAFGQWVANELHEPLSTVQTQLGTVQVEPGSFYWADYIRSYINGTSNSSGLKAQFVTILEQLLDGLDGITSGVNTLTQKYTTTEELNKASATDLANDFSSASTYFQQLGSSGPSSSSGSGGGH
jgi:hypothetical protein